MTRLVVGITSVSSSANRILTLRLSEYLSALLDHCKCVIKGGTSC